MTVLSPEIKVVHKSDIIFQTSDIINFKVSYDCPGRNSQHFLFLNDKLSSSTKSVLQHIFLRDSKQNVSVIFARKQSPPISLESDSPLTSRH